MTMSIIKPTTLTTAMLTSSTAAETDYTAWNPATTYAVGDRVMRTGVHRNYEAILAGVDTGLPEATTSRWLDLGSTNRWAMFDQKIGTSTTVATSPLTIVATPGPLGGIALMEMKGRDVTVTVKSSPGGTEIYRHAQMLDGTVISTFFDWFYQEAVLQVDLLLMDLPTQYNGCEVTVSITGSTAVSCGICHFGEVSKIGMTTHGANIGITDYSVKSTDAFGNTTIVERAYSKRATMQVVTEKSDFNKLYKFLVSIRAIPCIYIATEKAGYESMVVYGFFKNFSIDVAYPYTHLCSLELEGLI